MTQIFRPVLDLYRDSQVVGQAGGTTNLYATIDEAVADDADYIKLPFANGGNTKVLVVTLDPLGGDPLSSVDHEIHWRVGENAFNGGHASIELRQDYIDEASKGTLIATTAVFDSSGADAFSDGVTKVLSSMEADAITDYSSLSLRIIFTNDNNFAETRVAQAWFQTPDAGPAVDPDTSSVSPLAATKAVDDQVTITVTVLNTDQDPVEAANVDFTVDGNGTVVSQPDPTDAQGVTTGIVSSDSELVQVVTVIANNVQLTEQATITYTDETAIVRDFQILSGGINAYDGTLELSVFLNKEAADQDVYTVLSRGGRVNIHDEFGFFLGSVTTGEQDSFRRVLDPVRPWRRIHANRKS